MTRERARQIQRLEGEFAAILPEKCAKAASALALYEQARLASDSGKILEALSLRESCCRRSSEAIGYTDFA